ncbi:hypothetical protein GF380_06285 [Candidatus Uhrbacteria bacterium]|nr:hypothetical protein [Candidatus Uhrbacteria bacterium]
MNRYKDHPALEAWQVENEILFPFGICPKTKRSFFKQEVELVRSLDPDHPIYTTDSGELSTWIVVGSLVDRLGISTYRVVTTVGGIVWRYRAIPPFWYARRAILARPFVGQVYVSEFQMEPWSDQSLADAPLEEQFRTFPIEQMKDNFHYAERMRFEEVYFWGVEWWYFMKTKKNDDRFWEMAKRFYASHHIP